jgi:hypothetical protein
MLQVVLFHCLQFLYVLLDFFRSVLEGYQLKRFRHIFRRKKRGNKTNFHVPKHFAVLFTEAHLIHWTWIADLIRHASVNGVERLTFYDPWSILTTREKQLRTYLCKEFPEKRKTRSLLFDDEAAPPFSKGAIVVEVIDARSGKDALIHTCKQFATSNDEITVSRITENLAHYRVFEPDFLLRLGNVSTFAGYPPWSLRVTEVHTVPKFLSAKRVDEREFEALLNVYSTRDRRLGR